MFNRLKAWIFLLKSGIISYRKEFNSFYRGNIIKAFDEEGLFEFLSEPKTYLEIVSNFNYTNKELLQEVLEVLVNDKTLLQFENETFQCNHNINRSWQVPRIYDEITINLWIKHANALPEALRGNYISFSGFNKIEGWDNALQNRFYRETRLAAFKYSGVLNKSGTFLDVGCGTGHSTVDTWSEYYKNNKLINNGLQIYGVDISEEFLEVARRNFAQNTSNIVKQPIEKIQSYKEYFPKFVKGSVDALPFGNNFFDIIYVAFVLNWVNTKDALKELIRITKPGGTIFGIHGIYPKANKFSGLHCKVVKDAFGFTNKESFYRWIKEAGAKKVSNVTPLTIFKIIK